MKVVLQLNTLQSLTAVTIRGIQITSFPDGKDGNYNHKTMQRKLSTTAIHSVGQLTILQYFYLIYPFFLTIVSLLSKFLLALLHLQAFLRIIFD